MSAVTRSDGPRRSQAGAPLPARPREACAEGRPHENSEPPSGTCLTGDGGPRRRLRSGQRPLLVGQVGCLRHPPRPAYPVMLDIAGSGTVPSPTGGLLCSGDPRALADAAGPGRAPVSRRARTTASPRTDRGACRVTRASRATGERIRDREAAARRTPAGRCRGDRRPGANVSHVSHVNAGMGRSAGGAVSVPSQTPARQTEPVVVMRAARRELSRPRRTRRPHPWPCCSCRRRIRSRRPALPRPRELVAGAAACSCRAPSRRARDHA